jgi:anaerobic selenocysteine-containing dehydrogenase
MCGIDVTIKDTEIVKVSPMKEFPFNRGVLCPKGIASVELQNHPERLRHPLKKVGEGWERISWDEALNYVSEKLLDVRSRFGSEALCMVTGDCKLNESEGFLVRRLMNLFGTPNIVTPATVCQYPRSFVDTVTAGSPFHRYFDLTTTDLILCWGSNPAASHFSTTWMDVLNARSRGAKIIVIDPRITDTASIADLHLQPRPGTDGAIALGLLNVIIKEELFDKEFVENWTHGFQELAELVQEFPPERVEEITEINRETVKQIARTYATTRQACMFLGNSLDHSTNGIQNMRAIDILIAVTGHLDRLGCNLFYPNIPLSDISLSDALPRETRRIGGEYPLFRVGTHMGALIEALNTETPYPVKAMIVNYMNPMLSWPDSNAVEKGLKSLEFLVVMDFFMTPTAELAHIVLPAATFFERTRLLTHMGRPTLSGGETPCYITLAEQVLDPVEECRSDWWFYMELAKKLGYAEYFRWENIESMIEEQLEASGIKITDLRKNPSGLFYGKPRAYRTYEGEGFKTPTGKVEIYSTIFEKNGYDPLPSYVEPVESPLSTPELFEDYPLMLFTGAKHVAYAQSSWRELPSLNKICPEPRIDINPGTANRLEINDGDEVTLETLRGSLKVKANVTLDIMPDVVHLPHGWRDANANLLTDHKMRDPVLGLVAMKTMLCRIRK